MCTQIYQCRGLTVSVGIGLSDLTGAALQLLAQPGSSSPGKSPLSGHRPFPHFVASPSMAFRARENSPFWHQPSTLACELSEGGKVRFLLQIFNLGAEQALHWLEK